ncbi:hypothetical protein HanPI659440_Chr04g0156791 [Helianthus annuus]|nr:hypothetical protein HanPI659440_Chr04g0156791 [Helianthus annuus]
MKHTVLLRLNPLAGRFQLLVLSIKDDFSKKYGGGKAATATANSLNKEFGKLSKVKARVSEVKGVMMENIEKVRSM